MGAPFVAESSITEGSVVSLSPTGGVVKGFGMQLSGAFATTGFINNPILLNMTGSVVVLLYNTSAFTGQAVYFDTTTTSPGVRHAWLCRQRPWAQQFVY